MESFPRFWFDGRLLVFPVNIRLGEKGLKVANKLAYYDTVKITAVNIFIVQAPGEIVSYYQKVNQLNH